MAFNKDSEITYEVKPNGVNALIDEKNNTVMMLREVGWNGRDHHLELRRWIVEENGERPSKGVTFMSDAGPHNLVDVMTGLGYGNTKTILNNIKERADFEPSLVDAIGMQKVIQAKNTEVEIGEDDYFDPRRLSIEPSHREEEEYA